MSLIFSMAVDIFSCWIKCSLLILLLRCIRSLLPTSSFLAKMWHFVTRWHRIFFTHSSQWVTEARNSTWQMTSAWEINIVVCYFRYTVRSKPAQMSLPRRSFTPQAKRAEGIVKKRLCPRCGLRVWNYTQRVDKLLWTRFVFSYSQTVRKQSATSEILFLVSSQTWKRHTKK